MKKAAKSSSVYSGGDSPEILLRLYFVTFNSFFSSNQMLFSDLKSSWCGCNTPCSWCISHFIKMPAAQGRRALKCVFMNLKLQTLFFLVVVLLFK